MNSCRKWDCAFLSIQHKCGQNLIYIFWLVDFLRVVPRKNMRTSFSLSIYRWDILWWRSFGIQDSEIRGFDKNVYEKFNLKNFIAKFMCNFILLVQLWPHLPMTAMSVALFLAMVTFMYRIRFHNFMHKLFIILLFSISIEALNRQNTSLLHSHMYMHERQRKHTKNYCKGNKKSAKSQSKKKECDRSQ